MIEVLSCSLVSNAFETTCFQESDSVQGESSRQLAFFIRRGKYVKKVMG